MSALLVTVPDELVDAVAQRAVALLEERAAPPRSPYMTTDEAAAYLACSRQRIHDLLSAGKLSRYKEGRRTLLLRAELDRLVVLERSARLPRRGIGPIVRETS